MLEGETTRLTSELVDVLRQLNVLTHPSRLPQELLEKIFMDLNPRPPSGRGAEMNSDSVTLAKRDLVAATHVCHHWRETALQCPRLWCYIDFGRKHSYVQALLERSRDCSIYAWCLEKGWKGQAVVLILGAIDRICYLAVPSRMSSSTSDPLVAHPSHAVQAPRLLEFQEGEASAPVNAPDNNISLLSLISAPLLHSVALSAANPATCKVLHTTTSIAYLSISCRIVCELPARVSRLLPGVRDLFHLFQHLPGLRSLALRGVVLDAQEVDDFRITVDLPRLEKLLIVGDWLCFALVANYMTFPMSTATNIVANSTGVRVYPLTIDAPRLAAPWPFIDRMARANKDHPGVLSGVEVSLRRWLASDEISVYGWTTRERRLGTSLSLDTHSAFALRVGTADAVPNVLHAGLNSLVGVHDLRLEDIVPYSAHMVPVLRAVRSVGNDVKNLTLIIPFQGIQQALSEVLGHPEACDTVHFPNLQSLSVEAFCFCQCPGHRAELLVYSLDSGATEEKCTIFEDNGEACRLILHHLLSILKRRERIGLPRLQELVLILGPCSSVHDVDSELEELSQLASYVSRVRRTVCIPTVSDVKKVFSRMRWSTY